MLANYLIKDRIAFITINRPDKRNALNANLVSDLSALFDKAENDAQVKIIILNAEGDVFSAGADLDYLKQLQSNSFEANLKDSNLLKNLFQKIYTHPKIVIAQVEGHAIAGGCGLATVCDFVFSTPESKFGYTEVKIGFIPAIVTVFCVRKIGESQTKQLLFTGELISADRAKDINLINYVVEKDKIEQEVLDFANKLCFSASTQSLALTKQLLTNIQDLPLNEALDYAAEMNAHARSTDDCKKGIEAFLNKNQIKW
jgi:methylglutaconyl-CoA hydratase